VAIRGGRNVVGYSGDGKWGHGGKREGYEKGVFLKEKNRATIGALSSQRLIEGGEYHRGGPGKEDGISEGEY